MKPSTKLKLIREKGGIEPLALAAASGISGPEYYDLEATDDLENSIDLDHLKRLSSALNIRLATLFSPNVPDDRISPTDLRSLLEEKIKSRHVELSQFEDEVGWELAAFMEYPESALLRWNMTCLYDVCRALGCSWVAVLNGVDS